MKRFLLSCILLIAAAASASAQSSMTDDQVLQYVMQEYQKGTSQSQIVTKLMQKGVDETQIRRVRAKYERQQQGGGLGTEQLLGTGQKTTGADRMRTGTSVGRQGYDSKYQVREIQADGRVAYDSSNPEFGLISDGISGLFPDSLGFIPPQKRVFGRDIFNNNSLTFESNINIATPADYVLGAGDVVNIDIYGASQKSLECTVTPDGTIIIDGYGPISVGGLTVAEANSRLRSTLGERYSSSQMTLTVGQTKTITVNVMGEVQAPGTYTLSAFATVFHALYMAGGISDIGTLRSIKVYRDNKLITTVDIYDYILNGKLSGNIRLASGDVIVVGPYDCIVDVAGRVKRPMLYEMRSTESVATAIQYAGGFSGDAYTKTVRLTRKAGSQYSVYSIDEFDLASFSLLDADSITVDSTLARFSNMVEIRGAVFRPGIYELGGSITTVRSLIEKADGLTEDAFRNRAVMHRLREDRTLEILALDIGGIMEGTSADIPLRNEDVIYIHGERELLEAQTITIYGEVLYPGIYKYAAGETVEDFIIQAGGLTESATVMKVDVSRRIADRYATSTSDTIAQTFTMTIKDGFVIDGQQGFVLKPYDEVYVRTSPIYSKQQNVKIEGEILYGGTYTLARKSQRLSEIVEQAGGLTPMAYAKGARLERTITPDERLRMETVLKMIKAQSGEKDTLDVNKLDLGSTYYVGIDMEKALENPGSSYDIVLREGDKITIPQYSGTVKISGDVMYPTTIAYRDGKKLNYYIDQAGGWGNRAKKKRTYIINMNGTVAKAKGSTKIEPGSEIVVPSKPAASRMTTAEVVALASGTASIATMIATIANLIK